MTILSGKNVNKLFFPPLTFFNDKWDPKITSVVSEIRKGEKFYLLVLGIN